MRFFLNYDNGYIVTFEHLDDNGYVRNTPLRKFRDQGDALAFREYDCPKLTLTQLRMLMKNYSPFRLYKRINHNKFERL